MQIMVIEFSKDDDPKVLEALRMHARQLRRKQDAAGAITAGKIELAFSKALDERKTSDEASAATAERE